MASLEDQEREDEELADFDIGFQDRLDCDGFEGPTGSDLVLTKGRTPDQMWARLEALRSENRHLGPGWARGWAAAHESQKK